jgi:hypothetical protein
VLAYISAGDTYQVNLSTRLEVPAVDPALAYAALRHSTLPVCGREALDLDHHGWSYPPAIARSAGLRRLLPAPLKGWLRQQLAVR